MKHNNQQTPTNNTIIIAAASGLIFAGFAGPAGALLGALAGAGLGFWLDHNEKFIPTQEKNEIKTDRSKHPVIH